MVNNLHVCNNVGQLEMAFTWLDEILALVGLHFEPSKTELMHFAPKAQDMRQGCKPICFATLAYWQFLWFLFGLQLLLLLLSP